MSDTPAPTTALATIPASGDLQLTALQPSEIAQAQVSLIDWAKHKIGEVLLIASSKERKYVLAKRYGVSWGAIRDIKTGRNWNWLTKIRHHA